MRVCLVSVCTILCRQALHVISDGIGRDRRGVGTVVDGDGGSGGGTFVVLLAASG